MLTRRADAPKDELRHSGFTAELSAAVAVTLPELRAEIWQAQPDIARVCEYHLGFSDAHGNATSGGGGKLLRAGLVMATARGLGLQEAGRGLGLREADIAGPSTAVELLHNSTLLHDDVIDGDTTRRGRPTAWAVFGVDLAVLCGDALQVLGLQAATFAEPPGSRELSDLFAESLARVLGGQAHERAMCSNLGTDIAEYERMAGDKTGAMLECSMGAAAIRAGAPVRTFTALRWAAYHLGIAWQAANDVENLWGDTAMTGKDAYRDLRQRELTLPVLESLAVPGPKSAELHDRWCADVDTEENLDAIVSLIESVDGRSAALARSQHHLNQALEYLGQANLSQPGIEILDEAFRLIVNRTTSSYQEKS